MTLSRMAHDGSHPRATYCVHSGYAKPFVASKLVLTAIRSSFGRSWWICRARFFDGRLEVVRAFRSGWYHALLKGFDLYFLQTAPSCWCSQNSCDLFCQLERTNNNQEKHNTKIYVKNPDVEKTTEKEASYSTIKGEKYNVVQARSILSFLSTS